MPRHPLTPKQVAALTARNAQVDAAKLAFNHYVQAVRDEAGIADATPVRITDDALEWDDPEATA